MIDIHSEKQNRSITNFLTITFGLLYIFLFQMNYPFAADYFLYGISAVLFFSSLTKKRIVFNIQVVLFGMVVLFSFAGLFYTTMPAAGQREAILFLLFFVIFFLVGSDAQLITSFIRWAYFIAIITTITTIVQSVIPEQFNSFILPFFRKDCAEEFLSSYKIDKAFAGISAYTMNAAFFSALVFGQSYLNISKTNETPIIKNRVINIILIIISVYAIILSSKRGIFVAIVGATIILMAAIYRNRNFILRMIGILALVALLLYILYQSNEFIAAFMDRFTKSEDITTGRGDIYHFVWQYFLDGSILFGRGTGAVYSVASYGAHDIYLQLLCDHGIIFSIPFYLFLIYNYCYAFKNKSFMSLYFQSIFLIYGISGNPLYSNMFMIMYVFYILYANISTGGKKEYESRNIDLPQRR